jgi:hypothetical protein
VHLDTASSSAPGLSPGATDEDATWNVVGTTGTHSQAANDMPPPRLHQAVGPIAPGLSPGMMGGHTAPTKVPGLSSGSTGDRTATTKAPGPSPGAMAGLANVTTPPPKYADA